MTRRIPFHASLAITAALAVILSVPVSAQDIPADDLDAALRAHVRLLARPMGDHVILRWAVDKPAVWLASRRAGFIIERAEAGAGGRMPGDRDFRPIGGGPILPWTEQQWEAWFAANPPAPSGSMDYMTLAAAFATGEEDSQSTVPADDIATLRERRAQLEMRFGFALYTAERSASAADGLGLRLVDRDVTPGTIYVYRARMAGSAGVYRVDTGVVRVTNTRWTKPVLNALRAEERDGSILLVWPLLPYSSYRVERSTDAGRTWSELTAAPLMSVRAAGSEDSTDSFLDTLVVNYQPLRFRVHGSTPFADEDLVGELTAMGRDRTPPGTPFVPNAKQTAARAVRITWTMDAPPAADLAGFRVSRSVSEEDGYAPLHPRLLAPGSREFIDTSFAEHDPNFYVVTAVDTAGNEAPSLPSYVAVADSTAPAPPRWVDGVMDSTGRVTLTLRANAERDVMGYRLLRANAPDHEFSSVLEWFGDDDRTARLDTLLVDSVEVRSLTTTVYYRATALDRNFNESEFSDVLAVRRPDLVPPVAPVITDVQVTDSSVTLVYVPSTSLDVASHVFYRRNAGEDAWPPARAIAGIPGSMTDDAVERNRMYEYALQAIDSAGNASELSVSVMARPYDTGVRPGVDGLRATWEKELQRTTLRWSPPAMRSSFRCEVYRGTQRDALRRVAVVDGGVSEYHDTRPASGTWYYAVKVVVPAENASSRLSAPVPVEVPAR